MGDESEYLQSQEMFGDEGFMCHHPMKIKPIVVQSFKRWKDINGKEHNVKDMTSSHIRNCINMIDRRKWRTNWKEPLLKELNSRNECDATESDIY